MNNVVEEKSSQPNILQKIVGKVKQTITCLTDIYFIQISLVQNKKVDVVKTEANPNPNPSFLTVAEIVEKQYLILKDHDEIDYTKDLKQASQFKSGLGTLIVMKLRKIMKDSPNIQIDLVPVSQASFINFIQKGE